VICIYITNTDTIIADKGEPLTMQLEAIIERLWRCTWRPRLSEFGDALGGRDQASLKMYLQAVIEGIWTSTGRQSMDSALGAEIIFFG